MPDYGFIITRHVNSERTNRYWNQSVKLIRTFYPRRQIVVIDDNSVQDFVKADHNYKNLQVIQSEYKGRGELLPYVYLLRYKWFPNAVILHDSVFVHRHVPFEAISIPVLPLWHHSYDKENLPNLLRIASGLTNQRHLINKLNGSSINILGLTNKLEGFSLCFGVQTYINLDFLEKIEMKYRISRLVDYVFNRTDRCALERIMGLIFCEEFPRIKAIKSLFGDIVTQYRSFGYNYDNYLEDIQKGRALRPFVKVWTGR